MLKGLPKSIKNRDPVLLTTCNFIELILKLGGEVIINVFRKVVGEKFVNDTAHIGRFKTLLLKNNIISCL